MSKLKLERIREILAKSSHPIGEEFDEWKALFVMEEAVTAIEQKLALAVEALEFYANKENYEIIKIDTFYDLVSNKHFTRVNFNQMTSKARETLAIINGGGNKEGKTE